MIKKDKSHEHRFEIKTRIYWEDTDAGGVVYYANYLKFMERCRTDWLRALGIDQLQLRAARQLQFAVVSVAVDFLRPALLDDELLVTPELERLSGATFSFKQTILRGDVPGSSFLNTRVASLDSGTLKPRPIPKEIYSWSGVMGNDLSIWTLVLDASVIVQAVMVLLMIASVASWAVIFKKGRVISHSRRQADQFETAFWSGGDLSALYRSIETKGRAGTGEQSIFESGFGEFSRFCANSEHPRINCSREPAAPCGSPRCARWIGSAGTIWPCWPRSDRPALTWACSALFGAS